MFTSFIIWFVFIVDFFFFSSFESFTCVGFFFSVYFIVNFFFNLYFYTFVSTCILAYKPIILIFFHFLSMLSQFERLRITIDLLFHNRYSYIYMHSVYLDVLMFLSI